MFRGCSLFSCLVFLLWLKPMKQFRENGIAQIVTFKTQNDQKYKARCPGLLSDINLDTLPSFSDQYVSLKSTSKVINAGIKTL